MREKQKKERQKKAAAAIFPRGIFAAGRLTSEFGMGSGVSARQSQPPMK